MSTIFVVNGNTTVLPSPASPNSVGWIARLGRCFLGFVPTLGSRSTMQTCQRCGVAADAGIS